MRRRKTKRKQNKDKVQPVSTGSNYTAGLVRHMRMKSQMEELKKKQEKKKQKKIARDKSTKVITDVVNKQPPKGPTSDSNIEENL